jgi:probable HAF family extracellular repeat protein
VKVSDLGTLGGSDATALDISERREIVGWSYTASGDQHAFLYSGGIMTDIGPSIGPGPSVATGINNAGQIVGWGFPAAQQMGYLWNAGVATTLIGTGAGIPTGATSAFGINEYGDVCGSVAGATDAITWQANGTTVVMPTTSRPAYALDINLKSGMTGHGNGSVAWRWLLSAGVVVASAQIPYPAPTGYTIGAGTGINDRGAVAGRMSLTGVGDRAFFWDGKSPKSIDLGTLPTGKNAAAEDLNELRFIVGHASEQFSSAPVAFRERAFLYHNDFGMIALPNLRGTLRSQSCRAYALNEWDSTSSQMQIVGACDTAGGTRAVIWDAVVTLVP